MATSDLFRASYPNLVGAQQDFPIPFPYLEGSHVKAYVTPPGETLPVATTFEYLTPGLARVDPAPSGTLVLQRETPLAAPLSRLGPGTLSSAAINANATQAIYLAQEVSAAVQASVRFPEGEPVSPLPAASLRANRVQAYGPTGLPIPGPSVDDVNAAILNMNAANSNQGLATAVLYQAAGGDSIPQTVNDVIRRERLNLYDKIPKALWPAIEAGTNTTDLTSYILSAYGTGRAMSARAGRYRCAASLPAGVSKSLRGEGRQLTYFENVDNRATFTLDSSTGHFLGYEFEDLWIENRNPASYPNSDGIVITGAGDGETYQNDRHVLHRVWIYRFRDCLSILNRCVWLTLNDCELTGALRDALHVEVAANVNQLKLEDVLLKGAARNGLFLKHDYTSLATGWKLDNVSTEDCGYEGWRITGTGGVQGLQAICGTFENNAKLIAHNASAIVSGVRRRKATVFADAAYLAGVGFDGTTFYNVGPGDPDNPDTHIYMESSGAVLLYGHIEDCRGLPTQNESVVWGKGLRYAANNNFDGTISLDRAAGSIDERDQTALTPYIPAITFGGGTTGQAGAGKRRGLWQYQGRTVRFQTAITMAGDKGSSTGVAKVSLPVAAFNYADLPVAVTVSGAEMAGSAATQIIGEIAPGSSTIDLYRYSGGTKTALTHADFGDFTTLSLSGSYAF